MINVNDLIIRLMVMVDQATEPNEAKSIQKVIDILVHQREKEHNKF